MQTQSLEILAWYPYCHAVLHVETPAMTIESLKAIMKAQVIYHDKSNTWYGPVDQVLTKTGDWQTYRFTHIPTESGPWKLYVQVNGWGNFGNGVTVSVNDIRCQQRAAK